MKITIVRVEHLPPAHQSISTVNERCQTPDGVVHVGPACVYKAARHLIAHGVAPKTRMRTIRNGMTCLTGTVDAFARQTWGGSTKDPFHRAWAPHPEETLPPALAAWWEGIQK